MARPLAKVDPEMVMRLAAVGCSAEEIAAEVGCSRRTIYARFRTILSRGKLRSHVRLRSALFKFAMMGNPGLLVFLAKVELGMREPPEETVTVNTGPTNVVVLGPERARVLATRYEQVRSRTIERFEKLGNGNGKGSRETGAVD